MNAIYSYQNSPTQLVVKFSEDVSGTLSTADISIVDLATSTNLDFVLLPYNMATNTATISLPPGGLPDANYCATLTAAGITDAAGNALDGDANSIAGGDWNFNFFFLAADANHDGTVNALDFNALATNFGANGANFSQGDFNYDGTSTPSTSTPWQ